jgi:molybdopterin molybdotransferase
VIDLETAVARILGQMPGPQSELLSLDAAAGRILNESVTALLALPPFDNSAMDGYAVRAAEVQQANLMTPVRLKVRATLPAGKICSEEINSGECVRLFTGAPMPRGADAVVMQEDTRLEGDTVVILDGVKPGENVRRQGEDVSPGMILAQGGTEISAGLIGLLGAVGQAQVGVGRRPVVGLIATGSELREAGQVLQLGQIYESNRAMLLPLVTHAGGLAKVYPIVADTLPATTAALETAFRECDFVLTSGGVSVGEMDFVKAAFTALGGRLEFWRVAIRPGKPFVFGTLGTKFLCGLPGNPVSAFVTFLLLVRPALRRWQGATETDLPELPGVLGESFSNPGERRHFVRVRVDAEGRIFSAGKQASHALSSLAAAQGLLDLAPGVVMPQGSAARWRRIH